MAAIARLRPGEFAVALITAATVVVVGVEQGIFLAMALSILEHISTATGRTTRFGGPRRGRPHAARDRTERRPGLVSTVRAGLYYANAAGSPRRCWASSRTPTRRSAGSASTRRPRRHRLLGLRHPPRRPGRARAQGRDRVRRGRRQGARPARRVRAHREDRRREHTTRRPRDARRVRRALAVSGR